MGDATATATSETNALDDRLIERCELIPDDPAPGAYVVVDTMHFSNTVIELLANGAEYVHITEERGEEFAYRESNPRALIGGGSTDEYEPTDGYDFFNSPSYVQGLDVDGRPVSMTSSNGGRAVAALRANGSDGVDVYVGSTMNATALGRHLRDRAGPIHLVSSGSKGDLAIEDHVGATLISRALDGVELSETERELFRRQVKHAKGVDYVDKHELRRRDVLDYATNFDSRAVIPKLVGESLVDAAVARKEAEAPRQASD
ncbi:2-phosphosulfolactate phosphatase [Haloarculaceae archaeon H-GB1-1]|nr:2-phosphosulfolactate phosphatase [Haloarculaceae archaeon H-GB1-1]